MTPKSQLARNLRIITCTILAIGVATVVLLVFVFVINSREQEKLIETQLDAHTTLIELQAAIGYGGMIHKFKNWVLRPDEPYYRDRAIETGQRALALLDHLETTASIERLSLSLDAERKTIEAYMKNIALVSELHAQGMPPGDIDYRVRINDDEALAQLGVLQQKMIESMRAQQRELVARKNILLMQPTLIIAILLTMLLLLVRQRAHIRSDFDALRVSEMEQFTQIAAHDLRTPLRHIASLAEFAAEELESDDAPGRAAAREHIDGIFERTRKLEALIRAVFRYIMIDGASQEIETVNLRELVIDLGALHIPEGGTLRLEGEFPVVRAQRVELEIILRNLMSNAVKHHPTGTPTITLRYSRKGRLHQFEVEDDGPGIPEEHAEKVFGMFWTPNLDKETGDVSGVGLALVRRIVNRWGTELSMSNANPTGAIFRFSMPVI
ncbi:hypothetical protein GI582_14400 [Sulfitobacter sp. BDSS02]|nr:hypothetical protein [Sulfitobacter sp. BDSS02]MBR9850129.1 HAMP domain-containing histidine kinase [Paracoccaceae bacterium]